MRGLKSRIIERGWLRPGEVPLLPRLAWPLPVDTSEIHEFNRPARDTVFDHVLSGAADPVDNPSILGPEEEVVIAEVDRYGIPLRTVLGLRSGLMRSDPYYSTDYLSRFYRDHYRRLYRPRRFSESWFLSEQIRNGQRILERLAGRIPPRGRILDIGCGMGGMLIPFQFAGWEVCGCDYGAEYAARGRALNLNIRVGGPESVTGDGPFDLVLLSHVVEHTADPVMFLRQATAALKPTGVCWIEVPGLLNLEKNYDGDLLHYLQNAHRWHFTAATLAAVATRAGLRVMETDEAICCLVAPDVSDPDARAADGPRVLQELGRLETARAA